MIRPLVASDRSSVVLLLEATENFSDAEVAIAVELMDAVVDRPDQTDYSAFVADRTFPRKPQTHEDTDTVAPNDDPGRDPAMSSLVGFLLIGPTPATSGTWDLYWIAVHPLAQGSGVASALSRFAESIVVSRGGYWLIAQTSGRPSYARARAFYEKQGFVALSRIPDYYRRGEDLVTYGKRLDVDPTPSRTPGAPPGEQRAARASIR